MLFKALEAAEELDKDRISCEVIDPRTLVPLDLDTVLNSVKRTGRLVVVTEACKRGSVASDISAKVTENAFDWLDAPVKIVAGLNTPIPYNSTLEQASVPHMEDIADAVRSLL